MNDINDVDAEAFHWVILQDEGPLPSEQQRALDLWLAQSPSHLDAFIKARAVSDLCQRVGALTRPVPPPARPPDLGRRRLLGAAVSGLAVTGLAAGLWRWLEVPGSGGGYVTRVGETRTVALADASEVLLNTATEVLIRGGRVPEIQLLRGEAFFTIAHAARPFTIYVNDWVLRTAHATFAALKGRDHVDVTVQTGVIEARPDLFGASSQQLAANDEAILHQGGMAEVRPLSQEQVVERLAWRKGMVVFDNTAARDAVAQINRYATRKIVLDDQPIFDHTITGVFRCTDTETFVDALEIRLGARAIERGNSIFLTSSKSAGGA